MECLRAIIANDHNRVRALVKSQSLPSLKKLYMKLKWYNYDLYVDYIRSHGRYRMVLTQLNLNDDVTKYIGEFI